MKKLIFSLLLFCMYFSCGKEPLPKDTSLRFEGLKINHRFQLPTQNFTNGDNKSDTEKVKDIISKANAVFLNSTPEKISNALKTAIQKFPYPFEKIRAITDIAMIKKDFPDLSTEKIIENEEAISLYYSMNLAYEVSQILKPTTTTPLKKTAVFLDRQQHPSNTMKNCETKMQGHSGIMKKMCIVRKVYDLPKKWEQNRETYNYLKMVYALSRSQESDSFKGTDNRADAKRHLFGSILMAKYYLSIFAQKDKRADISEKLGDINEECSDNFVDGSTMDTHNNAVGVYLFKKHLTINSDHTFSMPSDDALRKIVSDYVDKNAKKIKDGGKTGDTKICYRKNEILKLKGEKNPVYLID